jgi:hypothetical protein
MPCHLSKLKTQKSFHFKNSFQLKGNSLIVDAKFLKWKLLVTIVITMANR